MPELSTSRHDRRYRLLVAITLVSCASSRLRAQSPGPPAAPVLTEEPNWQAICKTAIARPLPPAAESLAQTASKAARKPCDETRAYYGFEKAPDYPDAVRCAYLHRAHPGWAQGEFVFGPATLSMLYANGYGVPRNYDLAIRFECEAAGDSASEESSLSIGRLEAMRDAKLPHDQPFDLCEDATSGARGSYCEALSQQKADVGRARRLKELRSHLPQAAQALLPEVQAAETSFEQARAKGEDTGGGGSGSAGFIELDQGQLREQFLINLRRFAAADLPQATANDLSEAKRQMQAAFAAAEDKAQPPGMPNGNLGAPTPDKASLARTQQAWEALFAAWMRFVPVAYPQLSPDAAATELLRLRIHQLKHLDL